MEKSVLNKKHRYALWRCSWKIFFLIYMVLLLEPGKAHCQDFSSDYKKMFKAYLDHPSIYVETTYSIFKKKNDKQPARQRKGVFKSDKNKIHTKYYDYEMIDCPEYSLTVNHNAKLIYLTSKTSSDRKAEKKQKDKMTPGFIFSLIDSSVSVIGRIEYLGKSGSVKSYRMATTGPENGQFEVSIDTQTYFLSRLFIYATEEVKGEQPAMEIKYDRINASPVFREDDFSIYQFVSFVKGRFIPSRQFEKYHIVYN